MSIILKGIDMPKSCGECKFFCGLGYGSHCYLNGKHITFIGEVEDFCPLVEIPTPHGRLVDIDKVKDKLSDQIPYCGLDMTYSNSNAFDTMDNAPTILESEER